MALPAEVAVVAHASVSAALHTQSNGEARAMTPKISRLFSLLDENVSERHRNAALDPNADTCDPPHPPGEGASPSVEARADWILDPSLVLLGHDEKNPTGVPPYVSLQGAKTSALRQKIAALELLVDEKQQQLLEMKKIIEEQEAEKQQIQQQIQQQCKAEITQYEEALGRQVEMVDKLLADKNEFALRCDALAEQMQQAEQKFQERLDAVRRRCEKEAERQHRAFADAEKARREAWQREKTNEIKEMTIKGLEPEIQRLMDRHRDDKKRIEEKMRRVIDEVQRDCHEKLQLVKEHMARDEDENLERERAHHRRLMREQHEHFEKELREEREKCLAEQIEKEKQWELQRQALLAEAEEKVKAAVQEEQLHSRTRCEGFNTEIALLQQQHAKELEAMQHRIDQRELEWQNTLTEKVGEETSRQVEKIKEELSQERDKKLGIVIEKMGRDQLEQQQQQRRKMEAIVEKNRCEMNEQLKEKILQNEKLKIALQAKESEKEALEARLCQLEAIRSEKHEKIIECETRIEAQAKQARKAVEEKELELQRLNDALRTQQEAHAAELRAKDEECTRLKREASDAQEQAERVKRENDRHLELLETKIKQALWVKDETIRDLKEEMAALETKVAYFRDQHRKKREDLFAGTQVLSVSTEEKKQTSCSNTGSSTKSHITKIDKKSSSVGKSCSPTSELTTTAPLVDEDAKPPPRQNPPKGRAKAKK